MELNIGMVYKTKNLSAYAEEEEWIYFRIEKKADMIDGVWYEVLILYPYREKGMIKEEWCSTRNIFESTMGEIAIEILDSERETG
jgi:hypothetical protein